MKVNIVIRANYDLVMVLSVASVSATDHCIHSIQQETPSCY